MAGTLKVTLRRSAIGTSPRQRRTLQTLGLRRIGQSVAIVDTPANRGKVQTVQHLVDMEG
jgi:large subunit ribosomal protein L30